MLTPSEAVLTYVLRIVQSSASFKKQKGGWKSKTTDACTPDEVHAWFARAYTPKP
jgi:hypothetical protein